MLPDKSELKLLSSNPAGLRALLDYLTALQSYYDAEYTSTARKLVFAPEGRDTAVVTYGRKQMCAELIHDIKSINSITRGEK